MRGFRTLACLAVAGLALAPAGCGSDDPSEGLLSNVDKARNAASLAALQTGLVTVALVQADAPGGAAESLVPALQAKDPTNRYTTAPPTAPGIVQVSGRRRRAGDAGLAQLRSGCAAGSPCYVAAWQGAGTSMYYVGSDPPAYTAELPSGPGWSSTLAAIVPSTARRSPSADDGHDIVPA